jgi:hypothetical protein
MGFLIDRRYERLECGEIVIFYIPLDHSRSYVSGSSVYRVKLSKLETDSFL